jgi:hypothetical protein
MHTPDECPKCLRLRRALPENTARCCGQCLRWQNLYQCRFAILTHAVYMHIACVACGRGAWCRDMLEGDEHADACSYRVHVHAPGECPDRSSTQKA